jgi:hypothetical protein
LASVLHGLSHVTVAATAGPAGWRPGTSGYRDWNLKDSDRGSESDQICLGRVLPRAPGR